jgi:fatty acid desaturase
LGAAPGTYFHDEAAMNSDGLRICQSFLNPLQEITDPLAAITSVIVFPLWDRLHSSFSYHTEHHFFPQMNSDFYPRVSGLLQPQNRDRYQRVRIGEAWRSLWTGEVFTSDSTGKA